MADWQKIKTEYITTDTSYRKLAKKFGVSGTQIASVGKQEEWVELRKQYQCKALAKTLNAISSAQANRAKRLQTVADKLLSRVERTIDAMGDAECDTSAYRQIAATIKDIKDIQMIRSEADQREQEARIANLQKQAQLDEADTGVSITIDKIAEDYSI